MKSQSQSDRESERKKESNRERGMEKESQSESERKRESETVGKYQIHKICLCRSSYSTFVFYWSHSPFCALSEKAVKRAAEAVSQNMTDSLSKVGESNVISMHNYQVNIENENEKKKLRETERWTK